MKTEKCITRATSEKLKLTYGLDGFDVKDRQTLTGLLKMPFVNYNRV